jgi:type I restriction enzyme S subunit
MVPYLRVANVFEERIDTLDVMSMHFSSVEETKFQLHRGDILLNEGQSLELIGRPAMFRGELQRVCFTNSLVRYKAGKDINPEFALLVFLHYMHSGRFQKIAAITTNIAHLSAGRFSGLEFPVPPLHEQGEIVSKFDQHRDAIAQQQSAITRALTLAAAQRQNILRAAFSGQLVPQDPNDEPASVLFERIRTQRQAAAPTTKRKPGRPAKVTA